MEMTENAEIRRETGNYNRKEKKMFELFAIILFIWLLGKAIGLAFKLTWGVAKVAASILMAIALPVLVLCLLFAGGIALIVPLAIIGIAVGILKTC